MRENLKLPSGQVISATDPNYEEYASQMGVTTISQPQAQPQATQAPQAPQAPQAQQQQPQGYVPIDGTKYNTGELQKQNFSDIKPIGNTLYGIPNPIVPDVIPQQDFSKAMSGEELSKIEASAKGFTGFSSKQDEELNIAYQREIAGQATQADISNLNYARGKGWQPTIQEKGMSVPSDSVIGKSDTSMSTVDQILDLYSNIGNIRKLAREEAMKDHDLMAKGEAIATAQTLVNKLRTELQNKQIYDIKKQDELRGKPILTSQIQGQLDEMSREQKLDAMIMQNNYNNSLVELQIAQGNYDRAREIVNEIADDAFEAAMFQLDGLMFKHQIEEREYDRLQASLEYERDLALSGYVHLRSPEELEGLTEKDIFRDPVTGKIYLKPEPDVAQVIEIDGRMKGIDSKGNIIRDFGSSRGDLSISEQLAIREAGLHYDPATGQLYSEYERDPITGAKTDPSKVIGGFNFTSYATDPNWGTKISGIISNMPELNSIADLDSYIKSKNSSIAKANPNNTSQNAIAIWQSAEESGVPVALLTAVAQLESGFGTSNVAKNNNNPGGVTWNTNFPESMKGTARPSAEGGNYVKFPTLKDGFDAVAGNIARRFQGQAGTSSAFTGLEAAAIVTGVSPRLANNKELISEVESLLKGGVTRDDIEDELRYLSQSEIFDPWRNVANTALSSVKMTNQQRQANLDVIDDYISMGDNIGAVEHIKSTILGNVGATERKQVVGRQETLTSIYEIERLLNEYTSSGGDTGLLTGTAEKIQKKVLRSTKSEELAHIANEIAMTVQEYRQAMTGAQFTDAEAREYSAIFPSIGKVNKLNQALINSLKSRYERNQRLFWERQLGGAANYNRLEELSGSNIVGVGDIGRFSQEAVISSEVSDYLSQYGY